MVEMTKVASALIPVQATYVLQLVLPPLLLLLRPPDGFQDLECLDVSQFGCFDGNHDNAILKRGSHKETAVTSGSLSRILQLLRIAKLIQGRHWNIRR